MLVFTVAEVIQVVCEEELVLGLAGRRSSDTEKPRKSLTGSSPINRRYRYQQPITTQEITVGKPQNDEELFEKSGDGLIPDR